MNTEVQSVDRTRVRLEGEDLPSDTNVTIRLGCTQNSGKSIDYRFEFSLQKKTHYNNLTRTNQRNKIGKPSTQLSVLRIKAM